MKIFNMRRILWFKNVMFGLFILVLGVTSVWAGGGPNVTGAKLYIRQNQFDQAIKVLKKEIEEVNPNNEDAWYLLGYVYALQKDYDKMLEAFNKAVQLKPKLRKKGVSINGDPGTQFQAKNGVDIILKVIWGNSFNEAVQYFNNAINATTDSVRVANFEKSVEYFKLAAKILPDSALAYRNLAAALINLGKYEESIPYLEEAVKRAPKDAETKTMLASVYMTVGKDSIAIPMFEELWEQGNRNLDVADYLARAYIKQGKNEEAKAIYKEMIQSNPDNFSLRSNYGVLLLEAKQYDEAIEQLSKAYELDPENPDINYNLGAAYLNRGVAKRDSLPEGSTDSSYVEDFKKALPFLEKAVSMNPDDPQTWLTLAQIAGRTHKVALSGYALAKSEGTNSAINGMVRIGMQGADLKLILGEPDEVKKVESEVFGDVEEWMYKPKKANSKSKVDIKQPVNVYVRNGRVDAILVIK